MVIQPILNHTARSFGEIKMYAVMHNSHYEAGVTSVDGAHIHSCYEIYVNFSGDISFFHDSTIYDVAPHDVVVSYPGDVHHCVYHSSCTHAHFCVWFTGEEIGKFLERHSIRGKIRLAEEDVARLPHLLHQLEQPDTDPFLRAASLMEFLSMLDTEDHERHRATNDFPKVLNEMLSYLDQHLSDVVGWESLTQEFFLSKSTINRLFSKYVGISVGKLIEAKRLSLAEKMLHSDCSVTETCYRSGFSDCSRFIHCFKKKFGKTPLKYKQELFSRK